MTLENILADFQLLDDWEDRYRYVIELGRALPPLPEAARTEANRVRGCASQVWLTTEVNRATDGAAPRLIFKGDSDAHIVSSRATATPISCGASSPSSLRYTRAGARMKSFGSMRRACSGVSGWPST